ncbi:ThiF family adenylyltransferase [Ferrithrix thermotolerans]|nr:ThiF family adenylyltransferase [Ferrithrix thermotolerans]
MSNEHDSSITTIDAGAIGCASVLYLARAGFRDI